MASEKAQTKSGRPPVKPARPTPAPKKAVAKKSPGVVASAKKKVAQRRKRSK